MKIILALTALVKYPSSETSFYLSTNSYVVGKNNMQEIETATEDFKSHIEVDGFKIMNLIAYVVPAEQVTALE